MKMLSKILAVAGLLLAVSGAAQADMILCPVDLAHSNRVDGWGSAYGGNPVATSTDSDTGGASVEWGHVQYNPTMCGVQRFALVDGPIDASAYNGPNCEVGITIKIHDLTHFNPSHPKPVWIELGTDNVNTTQFVFDPTDIVADEWITLWAPISSGVATMGLPEGVGDMSNVDFAVVIIETVDKYVTIPVVGRLDQIALRVPEPATMALLAMGGACMLLRRRRR